jgi:type I restriction enzyme M protein
VVGCEPGLVVFLEVDPAGTELGDDGVEVVDLPCHLGVRAGRRACRLEQRELAGGAAVDAPKFKDYILPLVFLKRLSDVFDDEVTHLAEEFGDVATTEKLVEGDHKLVRFYVPQVARWGSISLKTTGVGQELTDAVRAIARENPRLQGVIDVVDFNATTAGQRIVDDQRLAALIQILSRHRLGLDDVEPDILGRADEYLLRKFAEGQGQSAGEFYTPREVAVLIARLLDPEPGMTVCDPCLAALRHEVKRCVQPLLVGAEAAKGKNRM